MKRFLRKHWATVLAIMTALGGCGPSLRIGVASISVAKNYGVGVESTQGFDRWLAGK